MSVHVCRVAPVLGGEADNLHGVDVGKVEGVGCKSNEQWGCRGGIAYAIIGYHKTVNVYVK